MRSLMGAKLATIAYFIVLSVRRGEPIAPDKRQEKDPGVGKGSRNEHLEAIVANADFRFPTQHFMTKNLEI
ncbi:hypothetical protein [Oxynema aestuarii]|uniref:Uncharacterized protein n=1 Tax=Oxynema aestuarii AP17 TaxID=2064643 RepID=A0A6H1TZL3_9CYAN|nr:hypothetical protein [Oxynema aestuarii]QIZ71213.1 hypothetical protein HCG48_12010 [Oxynema aestuarii AP17]RMH75005.1 MAG: hypothetical protein D6680_13085 [Cyanobacteria bacterium J007]